MKVRRNSSAFATKTLHLLVVGLVITACLGAAGPEFSDVSFVLGPKKFREGDGIIIRQVQSTSPKLEIGDKVVVRGHFALQSEEKAVLALYRTRIEDCSKEHIAPTQRILVKQGTGEFALAIEIKHTVALHLTFYRIPDGKPFGGVYFGTALQMDGIKDWTLADYEQ